MRRKKYLSSNAQLKLFIIKRMSISDVGVVSVSVYSMCVDEILFLLLRGTYSECGLTIYFSSLSTQNYTEFY